MGDWASWLWSRLGSWCSETYRWLINVGFPLVGEALSRHWWIYCVLVLVLSALLFPRVRVPARLRDSAPSQTLSNFAPGTRKAMKWSVVVGLSTLCVGIWADLTHQEWFSELSYIPNIWAALTGFLVGAPFALVILATFTVEREETASRRSVERLASNAWGAFVDAVMNLCSDARIEAATSQSIALNDAHIRTFRAMNFLVCTVRQTWIYRAYMLGDSGSDIISRDPGVHLKAVKDSLPAFKSELDKVISGLGTTEEVETLWSSVKGAWNVLDQYVRIQLLESSVDWFDSTEDALMRRDLRPDTNPLQSFIDVIGGEFAIWADTSSNVSGDYEYADNITQVDDEILREFVFNNEQSFGYTSNYFVGEANKAAQFMRRLRTRVETINGTGWPSKYPG